MRYSHNTIISTLFKKLLKIGYGFIPAEDLTGLPDDLKRYRDRVYNVVCSFI